MREATSGLSQAFADEDCNLAQKANQLPFLKQDTVFTNDFIKSKHKEVQAHLCRIADFLLPGKGVWWDKDEQCVAFHDSVERPDYHAEGPSLQHFRNTSVVQVLHSVTECWTECIQQRVPLPISKVRMDDGTGSARYVCWPPAEANSGTAPEKEDDPTRDTHQPTPENDATPPADEEQPVEREVINEGNYIPLEIVHKRLTTS